MRFLNLILEIPMSLHYRSLIILIPGLLMILPAEAESLAQFAMYALNVTHSDARCELVERHPGKRVFPGAYTEYGCQVSIPLQRYRTEFRFCYLAGINLYHQQQASELECFIQERESDALFLSHAKGGTGTKSQLMCYFSCMEQEAP